MNTGVKVENSIINIKNKMTEIRRKKNNRLIIQNYYNNCDSCKEIYTLYGDNSVVFWYYDNDNFDDLGNQKTTVIRGFFYSSDKDELKVLLRELPIGCVIDYVTKEKDEVLDLLSEAGLVLLYEMHKMSTVGIKKAEIKAIQKKKKLLKKMVYQPKNVRCAEPEELDDIYRKLYEIFDPRESHLPTKEELAHFIKNKWVSVYHEDGKMKGFHIFKVESGSFYGYQIWNETGPEGYLSLIICSDKLYVRYMRRHIGFYKKKPGYSWVNVKNKKSKRLIEYWGQRFTGLYDFVYEKAE